MKRTLAIILALCMLLTLCACGAKEEPAAAAPAEAAPAAPAEAAPAAEEKEPVTIDAFIVATEWGTAFDDMKAGFEAEYPWITIEGISRGGGNGAEFITTAIASGTLPDILAVDNNELIQTMVKDGLMEDFNQFACSEKIPQFYKDALTYDGILLGETYGAAFSCMFYNMAILNEAGWDKAPENWQELIACCKDIKDKTGVAPFTVAAGKTTTSWMLFELLIANACGEELGLGAYEEAFKNGTFEFNKYPEIVEKFNELQPYFLTGTSSANEDDVTTIMTDGQAAICLAGNWNGNAILDGITEYADGDATKAVAALPCFNDEGENRWISASAETGMGVTADPNRTEGEKEAIDLFVNYFWDNYAIIQNVAGNVPVIEMEGTVLKEQMTPLAAEMGASPSVTMGFNLWTTEFCDAANRDIQDCIAGLKDMQSAVDAMTELVKTSYKNQ